MNRETIEIDLTVSDSEPHDRNAEFVNWKQQLLDCLDSIKTAGDFSVSRNYSAHINPCVQIVGQETAIPLPLTDHDAERIRGACREAPFGKGDETLVDTSVRRTWELDATRFECTNPSWPAFLKGILKDVAAGFDLPEIKAKPYKLLLYEKGSFFKRHKDSEKEAGMIATLVVCLPGVHTGGDVHLSFGSEKRQLATAPVSRFDVTALAWFSDVDHEVKPLESGNRLVLTYKLFQPSGEEQSAQLLFGQTQKLKGILSKWQANFSDKAALAYPLDHLYTKTSLSIGNMKGRDRAVCHSIREISAECGLYLTLAHMTHSVIDEFDDYFHPNGEGATQLDTVYSCDGASIGSHCNIRDSEILVPKIFEDRDPDSGDEAEFTGNANMPAAFRYHNTVAVLTPMHQLSRYLVTSGWGGLTGESARNLMIMVRKERLRHPDIPVVNSSALQIMADILAASQGSEPKIQFDIASWALCMGQEELFQTALKGLLSGKNFPTATSHLAMITVLLEEAYKKSGKQVDWEELLGRFLPSTSLRAWDTILRTFTAHFGNGSLKDSFGLWAQSQLIAKLDAQTSFDMKDRWDTEDHDFFLDHLGRSVASDKILAAFASRSTRSFLFKVLESIFATREEYSEDTVKHLFKNTLEIARSRIAIKTQDLCVHGAGSSFRYVPKDHDSKIFLRQFTALVKQSLIVGVSEQVISLVEECYREFNSARSTWDPSRFDQEGLVEDLLVPLASAFYSSHVPLTANIKAFFELVIRDVLHHGLPKYPEDRDEGWSYKPLGCRSSCCEDCAEMDAFLVSRDQTSWMLRVAKPRRDHIDWRLSNWPFKTRQVHGRPVTLYFDKMEPRYNVDLKNFRRKLERFDNMLSPLQGIIFRTMLGEATYQEIVVLEHIRAGKDPASVAGAKRPSESDLAGDSARQRL